MREIKFRAWDKVNKKFVDWFAISISGELIKYDRKAGEEDQLVYRSEETMKKLLNYDFSNIVVMQFTGLLDKNGKEIFEGDFFEHQWLDGKTMEPKPETKSLWVVEWNDVEYCFLCKLLYREKNDLMTMKFKPLREFKFLSSIGNIHEHGHLLAEAAKGEG